MCGFLVIFNTRGGPVNRDMAGAMLDTMAHRGPDDRNIVFLDSAALGHRRLSIIDVSARGRQPMANEDQSIFVVFNGEIYNYVEIRRELERDHVFSSSSDTEVIIHAYEQWGTDCVNRFNGMFSFVIMDLGRHIIWGARDPIGIKPFYYYWDEKTFLAASEIKALLVDPMAPRTINLQALTEYLTFQYSLGDKTLFKSIKKLEPGRSFMIDKGVLTVRRYWDVKFDGSSEAGGHELSEELRTLLKSAIGRQLRSDVPVGCHLSGGIDSSIVTSIAAQIYPARLKTFTGRFDEGSDFDESYWALKVAEKAGAEPMFVTPDIDQFTDILPKLVYFLDEPVAGSGVFPQSSISRLASENVKVVLGGQGGDELFGGYKRYRKTALILMLQHGFSRPMFKHKSNLRFLLESGPVSLGKSAIAHFKRRNRKPGLGLIYAEVFADLAGAEYKALFAPQVLDSVLDPVLAFADQFNKLEEENPVNAVFRFDLENYLQALLNVEDRTSMMYSLESRVPLLDLEIVRFAARVPPDFKIHTRTNKYLLRQAGRPYLDDTVYNRTQKKGFPTPTALWFRNPDFPLFNEYVFSEDSLLESILNTNTIRTWHQAMLNGNNAYNGKLWKILCLGIWLKTFKVSI